VSASAAILSRQILQPISRRFVTHRRSTHSIEWVTTTTHDVSISTQANGSSAAGTLGEAETEQVIGGYFQPIKLQHGRMMLMDEDGLIKVEMRTPQPTARLQAEAGAQQVVTLVGDVPLVDYVPLRPLYK
jgi:hypothetical protein